MPRIRTIKPAAFSSESLARVPVEARWTFAGLWTYVDDDGRGKADPRLIRAHVWPLDDLVTAGDVEKMLDDLEREDMIRRYEVDGRSFLVVVNWHHQKISHPTPSTIPPPPSTTASEPPVEDSGEIPEDSVSAPDPFGPDREEDRDKDIDVESAEADPKIREDVERLCVRLADRIEANGSKRPRITKTWRDSARLLLDADGRSEEQVAKAIDWSQQHHFWRSVILSMPKLREKYDQMRLAAQEPAPAARRPSMLSAQLAARMADPLASAR